MSKHVYSKIVRVMADLGSIGKDARHGLGYKFQSVQSVKGKIQTLLIEHQLVILTQIVGWQVRDNRYIVDYEFDIVCAESGDCITRKWSSEAVLSLINKSGKETIDDKALGKAHSYGLKYFLLHLFMVSANDEPDADRTDSSHTPPATKTAGKAKPVIKHWVDNEADVERAAAEGKILVEEFGRDLIDEAKASCKNPYQYDSPQAYIKALGNYCEMKLVADADVSAGKDGEQKVVDFGKSVDEIIQPKGSASSSGDRFRSVVEDGG